MKIKASYSNVILIGITLLLSFTLFKYHQQTSNLEQLSLDYNHIVEYNDNLRICYQNQVIFNQMLKTFSFESMDLVNADGLSVNIKEYLLAEPLLILSLSETNCPVCISEELRRIRKIRFNFPNISFIILAKFNDARSLSSFIKINRINIPVFTSQDHRLPSDIIGRPTYSILNGQGLPIINVVANKEIPVLTHEILFENIEMYFTNN